MARIRTIKPEFAFDVELSKLPHIVRLFYILLWTQADRAGRGEDDPQKLRALIFPYEPTLDADAFMAALNPKFVTRYEAEGRSYYQINNWEKHQRPHIREIESSIPPAKSTKSKHNLKSARHNLGDAQHLPSTYPARLIKGMDTGEGKGMDTAAPSAQQVAAPIPASPKPRQLTGVQKVIRAFKEAKGVNAEDKEWDRKFFSRYSRIAKEVLDAFDGDGNKAILYILEKGLEWQHLADWGLEAILKAAGREQMKIKGVGSHEHENGPLGANSLLEPGRTGGLTRAGDITGHALRAIETTALHAEQPPKLDGGTPDFISDEESFS